VPGCPVPIRIRIRQHHCALVLHPPCAPAHLPRCFLPLLPSTVEASPSWNIWKRSVCVCVYWLTGPPSRRRTAFPPSQRFPGSAATITLRSESRSVARGFWRRTEPSNTMPGACGFSSGAAASLYLAIRVYWNISGQGPNRCWRLVCAITASNSKGVCHFGFRNRIGIRADNLPHLKAPGRPSSSGTVVAQSVFQHVPL